MSDEWKIAQGLKKKNESDRSNYEDAIIDKLDKETAPKRLAEEKNWEYWGAFSNFEEGIFKKEWEKGNIAAFGSFIQKCRLKGLTLPYEGKRGDVAFSIISENPLKVSFNTRAQKGDRFQKKDTNITIANDQVEYSQIEVKREVLFTECKHTGTLEFVTRSIYIMLNDSYPEINEYFSFLPPERRRMPIGYHMKDIGEINKLRDIVKNENPEFNVGNDGELYRLEIDPTEKVRSFVGKDGLGFYEHPDDCPDEKFDDGNALKGTYGEYVEDAKKIEKRCKYIYSLIVQAYKDLGEHVLTGISENEKKAKETELADEIKLKQIRTKELEEEIDSLEGKNKGQSR